MDAGYIDANGLPHRPLPSDTIGERTSVYALIRRNNLFLITVTTKWSELQEFPGGGVLPGETLLRALVREVSEETGYSVVPKEAPFYSTRSKFYNIDTNRFYDSLCHFYEADLLDDIARPLSIEISNREITSVNETSSTSADEQNMKPMHLEALHAYLRMQLPIT